MSDFLISTQASTWLLTPTQLDHFKSQLLQKHDSRAHDELPQLLQDEELSTQYFCRQIMIVFGKIPGAQKILRRKWRVPATAVVYFRRFYINHTMLDYDPRLILLASIFLAGKTEENFIQVKDLQLIFKHTEEDVLAAEKVLLDGIKFDLRIHHPHNCVHAILADWKRWKVNQAVSDYEEETKRKQLSDLIKAWIDRAEIILNLLLTTMAAITYRPLTLAIYALLAIGEQAEKIELQNYLPEKLGNDHWIVITSELITLRHYGETMMDVNFDFMKNYMKRLKQINSWTLSTQ